MGYTMINRFLSCLFLEACVINTAPYLSSSHSSIDVDRHHDGCIYIIIISCSSAAFHLVHFHRFATRSLIIYLLLMVEMIRCLICYIIFMLFCWVVITTAYWRSCQSDEMERGMMSANIHVYN